MTRTYTRFAVLGGDGVFGIHMVKFLLGLPGTERVVSIGRNQRKPSVYSLDVGAGDERFAYYQAHMVHEHDILMRLIDSERPECVINFAALAYATSWTDSYRYYDTNVVSLARITEAIRDRDYFRHWMQIGSSEVYGPAIDGPCAEGSMPNPTSPYAVSKLAGDLHLKTYADSIGFPMNVIRPSNAYGPGQQLYRLMPRAAFCALTGRPFPLEGGGVAEKSFMHATDMASAVHRIIVSGAQGEVYNAGPDSAVSIRQIVELIAIAAGVDPTTFVTMAPGRATEDSRYWLDSTKIERELGWRPTISLEEGVTEMVEWARRYLPELERMPQQFALRS
ncbi:MAG: GDP-mannose 4,6-dehydratase [Actinomycetota bacterium]|nr:GDP-mannose 4,6-dehydratase [Actinomycetota bacterium]